MAKEKKPGKGDRVAWKSHGGEAVGKVEKKITERTEAAGRTVDASPEEPQYQVRSEKSGRSAVHRAEALHKPGGGSKGGGKGSEGGGKSGRKGD